MTAPWLALRTPRGWRPYPNMHTRYAVALGAFEALAAGDHQGWADAVTEGKALAALVAGECAQRDADAAIQPSFEWKYAVPPFVNRR